MCGSGVSARLAGDCQPFGRLRSFALGIGPVSLLGSKIGSTI
jgi:hypothetical protein